MEIANEVGGVVVIGESTDQKEKRYLGRAILLGILIGFSAYLGFGVGDMGATLDGMGYGHRVIQTSVTWALYCWAAVFVGACAFSVYRGWFGYIVGTILFMGAWVLVYLAVILSLGAHYDRICDEVDAPRACYSQSWLADCTANGDRSCFRRLQRSCELGHVRGCDRLKEQGEKTEEEVCKALAGACDESHRCAQESDKCGRDELPGTERYIFERVCEEHVERCE